MRILYHVPSLDSIYAHRTIYHGFKNAFVDMGHEFRPFTADDQLRNALENFQPNLFITSSHYYYRKFLDYGLLKSFRNDGLFVLTKIDFWNSPLSGLRVNEAKSIKDDKAVRRLIDAGLLGDAFFHVVEQGDARMDGFERETGCRYHTIPLAADRLALSDVYDANYAADISYVGSALPDKRAFFRRHVFPLRRAYKLRIYGQDWTLWDKSLGWVQRAGQYFNIKPLSRIRPAKLALGDEGRIYRSSTVSINVHEQYQKRFGGDCNERTFKIPVCGGFEVVDDVACIRKYFRPGEIAIAKSDSEWSDMVRYYLVNPAERLPIIEAGRKRVMHEHTYHNRAQYMMSLLAPALFGANPAKRSDSAAR